MWGFPGEGIQRSLLQVAGDAIDIRGENAMVGLPGGKPSG